MGKPAKKAAVKKDNSARIARAAERKKNNKAENELRHSQNVAALAALGMALIRGGKRPSKMIRAYNRKANGRDVLAEAEAELDL